jgi:hypothetical protein
MSAKTSVETSQINSLASSGFTEQHAPSSELQWKAILPAVFQAATPSADFNYKSPGHHAITTNRRPVTSRTLPQASHNISCVFAERANKSAYHLQPSINCGDTPTTENTLIEPHGSGAESCSPASSLTYTSPSHDIHAVTGVHNPSIPMFHVIPPSSSIYKGSLY